MLFIILWGGAFLYSKELFVSRRSGTDNDHSVQLKADVGQAAKNLTQELISVFIQNEGKDAQATVAMLLNVLEEHFAKTITTAMILEEIDSNTSKVFKGDRFRKFTGGHLFTNGWEKTIQTIDSTTTEAIRCKCWGVVTTTIFKPSEAVHRVGNMKGGWCLMIVADTKTPSKYLKKAGLENETDTVKYLTVEEQQAWGGNNTGTVAAFVRAIPY